MLNLTKDRSRSKLPKKKSKVLQNRRKFKRFEDATKTYHQKHSPEETLAWAQAKRQERLQNRTEAEREMECWLGRDNIRFEPEYFIQNGDRFVLLDLYLPDHKIAIELDGSQHKQQVRYDAGRDRWLLEDHKIRVIRFRNDQILKTPEVVLATIKELLK